MTSEVKKRKKGQILNSNERQLILNLIHYLKKKNAGRSISDVIREISKATGCSERTIYKIRKEGNNCVNIKKQRVRKKENKNSRNVKYDSFVKSSIRRKVHNHLLLSVPPTINSILCLVNSDPELPNFKRSTLHTLLKEIGFIYVQKGKKLLLSEKVDLIQSRQQYLKDVRRFRSENRWIIYTGETLVSLTKRNLSINKDNEKNLPLSCTNSIPINHSINTLSNYTNLTCPEDHTQDKQANLNLSNGLQLVNNISIISSLNNHSQLLTNELEYNTNTSLAIDIDMSSLGNTAMMDASVSTIPDISCDTSIPLHTIVTSDTYLITETREMREQEQQTDQDVINDESNTATSDKTSRELRFSIMHACCDEGFIQDVESIVLYKKKSEEINIYENWFMQKLLPKIPPNSVIVVDNNAPYHKLKESNIPDNSWKKQQIKNWLISNSINIGDVTQKKEMLAIVNDVKPSFSTKFKIDEIAKQRGITILTLPPYHYELNPLNMIWSRIKSNVQNNIKTYKIKKLKQLIKHSFISISHALWSDSVYHVRQMEDILWAVDEMQTNNIDNSGYKCDSDIGNEFIIKKCTSNQT